MFGSSFGDAKKFDYKWPTPVEAEMHIRTELSRLGIKFKEDHNSFSIVCPYPHPGGGVNTHLNFRLKKDGRTSHCFVCGQKGSWNRHAPTLGGAKFGATGLVSEEGVHVNLAAALRNRMAETALRDDVDDPEVPEGMTPWSGTWRRFSETFLNRAGAMEWNQCTRSKEGRIFWTPRIWFPCVQFGSYVGYAARRLDTKDILPYYNAPWMKSSEVLFGFDLAREISKESGITSVALVEGPVDALRLLDAGIPAVAVLGVENLGRKEALVMAAGFKKVFIVFDNDAPGKKATPDAVQQFSAVLPVEVVCCPEEPYDDPGKFLPEHTTWLRNHMRSHP